MLKALCVLCDNLCELCGRNKKAHHRALLNPMGGCLVSQAAGT